MAEVIERYAGDPEQVARELVDAANQAGGKDNVTAIFVAGTEFVGTQSPEMAEARVRHAITKVRSVVEAPVSCDRGAGAAVDLPGGVSGIRVRDRRGAGVGLALGEVGCWGRRNS